jgi:hypothetical protein
LVAGFIFLVFLTVGILAHLTLTSAVLILLFGILVLLALVLLVRLAGHILVLALLLLVVPILIIGLIHKASPVNERF